MWRAAVVIGVWAIGLWPVAPGPSQEGVTIARAFAEGDPPTFASGLAAAGQPAGFILPLSVRQGLYLPPDKGQRLGIDDAVKVFLGRNPGYSAALEGSTLVIRHGSVPEDISKALMSRRLLPAEKLTLSSALFDVLLRQLARRPVGGVVGSGPTPGPSCPIEQPVTIPAGRASVLDTMNGLVAQVKGVVWLVRFGAPGEAMRLQLGYVCSEGTWSALSVPGW